MPNKDGKYIYSDHSDKIKNNTEDKSLEYLNKYNTPLTDYEYPKFLNWARIRYGSPDNLSMEMGNYDIQGAYRGIMNGEFTPDSRGHLPDKYKKPNHITFSDESMYHTNDTPGGKWVETKIGWKYIPQKHTIERYGADYLNKYFQKYEPDSMLVMDDTSQL